MALFLPILMTNSPINYPKSEGMTIPRDILPEHTHEHVDANCDSELTMLHAHIAELERKSADLQWANDAIAALASDTGCATGLEFLQTLTRKLFHTLKVRDVFITEWVPGRTDRVRTVAGWCHNRTADPLEYDLSDTPCKQVLEAGEAFFPHGTRQLFPEDEYLAMHHIESYMGIALFNKAGQPTGHLCIMDAHPFSFNHAQGRMVAKVFSARASAELERLRAEEVLRTREEQFKTQYDNTPSMCFTLSPDGTIVSANQYGAAQLGYTTDELIGRSVLTVFDTADQYTVLSQLTECTDHPFRTFEWDIQKVRKDGTRLWVHERARAIVDSHETATILIICEDVTEQRRESQLLSTLIDNSPLPIISLDHQARVTSWNPAATQLFGWSEDELLGREIPYVQSGSESAADALWEASTRGELVGPIEMRRQRKDGALLDLLLWPVFLRDNPDDNGRAIGIFVDQSELKQAEAARKESDRRLQLIINSEPECVMTVRPDGSIMSINPAGLAMIGAASEQAILGQSVFSLIHPNDRPAYEHFHQRVCAGETAILAFEIIDLLGTKRHLEAHSVPFRNDQGTLIATLSITRDVTIRKHTEDALRASEERFRLIAETVEEVFWSADSRLENMLYVSPAYERIWGRTCDSLRAQPTSFLDAVHPDDRARAVDGLAALQQDGLPFGEEYRVVRPDGEIRWVWDRGFPVRAPDTGALTHYVGVALDITERKQVEQELCVTRDRLQFLISSNPAVLYTYKPSGDFDATYISDNITQQLGYEPREFLEDSQFWAAHIHPDDRPRMFAELSRLFQDGYHVHDYRFLHKDGTYRWMHDQLKLIRDTDGTPIEIIGSWIDITDRKRSEEALKASEACLHRFVANAPIGLVILDKDRILIQANKAFCQLTGYEEHEVLGRSYELYTHPDDLPTNIALTDEFYRGLRSDYVYEKRYIRKSGEIIWVLIKAVRVELPGYPGPLLLAAVQDVTSQRQALEEREQLSRDLHDSILQSLYAVGMHLEAAKLAGEQSSRKFKARLKQAISHLNHLVLDVRQFITLLTQQRVITVDFGRTLRQLATSMFAAGQSAPEIEVPDNVLSVLSPLQGQQLLNIAREALSNSMRHAQATRRWVRLIRTKETIDMEIGDDGVGFTPRRTPRRGHGLANMAARAKTLRAHFSLDTVKGKGTRITVKIPIEKGTPNGKIQRDSSGDRRRPRSRPHRAQRGT